MRLMMWIVMTILLVTFSGCVGFMVDMACLLADSPSCQGVREAFDYSIAFGLMSGAFWLAIIIGVLTIVMSAVKKRGGHR